MFVLVCLCVDFFFYDYTINILPTSQGYLKTKDQVEIDMVCVIIKVKYSPLKLL